MTLVGKFETPATSAPRQEQSATCSHCGLAVPAGLIQPGAPAQFCCTGCRTVFEFTHESGLGRFYDLRSEESGGTTGSRDAPARATQRPYAEFDDPAFQDLYVRKPTPATRSVELLIEGVHCAACVWLIERLPLITPGVFEARLDIRRARLQITWDPAQIALSSIARQLDRLGYPPHPARGVSAREIRTREERHYLIRIAVAGAISGNVMLLAFALYSGLAAGMESRYESLFRWLSMGLSAVALAWPGQVFFRGAWASLRTRTSSLDVPIALGLGVGAAAGIVNTIAGRGEIYFDSLTALVFLLLIGRWVQYRQQRFAGDAVELLFSLTPTAARRIEAGEIHDVAIDALQPGELVEVRAGESFPVDGVVETGCSDVDQALLTGEARPMRVTPGESVAAGAVNLTESLRVRVQATGTATRVGKLMQLVEESARNRASIVQFADRVGGWFVIAVILLAAATLLGWWTLNPALAADRTVALLIVACPCAFGLATPLGLAVAIGRAARRGILIKGGAALEQLAHPGTIWLDKTGTLTAGRASLMHWVGDDSVKPLVAAIESRSAHPLARAFVRDFGPSPLADAAAVQFADGGICGSVGGHNLVIGAPEFVRERLTAEYPVDEYAETTASGLAEIVRHGLTPVMIAVDGRLRAAAGFGDPIGADVPAAIARLRNLGWRIGILSGDHAAPVRHTAQALGIDPAACHSGMTPEAKLAFVKRALADSSGRPVVMVGDGVNDAAALAAASVGIAVHGGAEASLAAADVYLNRPGLASVVDLVVASRRTLAAVRRGLIASLAYNAFAVTLAVAGLLNPLIAAILMPVSSFTVVALAVVTRTFADARRGSEPNADAALPQLRRTAFARPATAAEVFSCR